MAVVVVVLRSLVITFDPNVEGNEEITYEETASGNTSLISKIKKVFDFSVWKEPPVIAFFIPAFLLSFGHFVPLIHMVSKFAVKFTYVQPLLTSNTRCPHMSRHLLPILNNKVRVKVRLTFRGRERTKRGALLHGVPYGVPKWSTPTNHLFAKLNTLSTW